VALARRLFVLPSDVVAVTAKFTPVSAVYLLHFLPVGARSVVDGAFFWGSAASLAVALKSRVCADGALSDQ
jgi:hypothetical protein